MVMRARLCGNARRSVVSIVDRIRNTRSTGRRDVAIFDASGKSLF